MRFWKWLSRSQSQCSECGAHQFKQSKLTGHHYCNGCNKNYYGQRPTFPLIHCSKHGRQYEHVAKYWCAQCQDEDRTCRGTSWDGSPPVVPLTEVFGLLDAQHDDV